MTDPMRSAGAVTVHRREPVLYFHTSNTEKFIQARILASAHGVRLSQFVAGAEPYDEDYALAPRDMLATALNQAVRAAGRGSLVFVEDTTVRIDALSTDDVDTPGLRTKEWFQETTFEELHLRLGGRARTARVRSDIALSLPGLHEPVFFRGETAGHVVTAPPADRVHPLYTWLSTRTFNGWFVPLGANVTLGEMEYDESLKYDFRAKSLQKIFDRVREYAAVLSVPPKAYRRPSLARPSAADRMQPSLFSVGQEEGRSPLIVLGESCAGKTTMARAAIARSNAVHLEASEFLEPLIEKASAPLPDRRQDPAFFASALLGSVGFDAVAQLMVELHEDEMRSGDAIITGFRTIEELRFVLRVFPESPVVHVSSPFNMRYERFSLRKRELSATNLSPSDFRRRDEMQREFGLLPVARELSDILVENLLTEEDYLGEALKVWDAHLLRPSRFEAGAGTQASSRGATRLSRCLELLRDQGPMTLPEIEDQLRLGDHNASRILGFSPRTTSRIDVPGGGRVRWQITDAGNAYLELITRPVQRLKSERGSGTTDSTHTAPRQDLQTHEPDS